jgi:hypothetical protein
MSNIFNADFIDFIQALNDAKVEYILVGGYSVIIHGYHRTTGDMDIWVKPDIENFEKLQLCLKKFGIPLNFIQINDFLDTEKFDVFTFGRPPVSIDLMTKVSGLDFNPVFEHIYVRVIHVNDLIQAKKTAGRYKDLDDIENITKNIT